MKVRYVFHCSKFLLRRSRSRYFRNLHVSPDDGMPGTRSFVNMTYTPNNKIRIVTAAALFDGHDAAINIMRRIMQGTGAEVIHWATTAPPRRS